MSRPALPARASATLALAVATALIGVAMPPRPALAAPQTATAAETAVAETKAQRLDRLYAEYWEEALELDPVRATFQGDPRYNDRLPDIYSAEYREQTRAFTQRWLTRIEAIGPEGLSGQALASYEIFVGKAKDTLYADRFPDWMMPVDQMSNVITLSTMLGSGTGAQPFRTVQDYEHWLARGDRLPVLIDSAIASMREGVRAGVVQPRALMTKVVPQIDAVMNDDPEKTLFWGPIRSMPAEFGTADRTRLTAAYREMIATRVMPSFRKMRDFIANEYLPATRDSVGMDKLPGGAEWYAFNVRQSTTTDLTPAQIHQIGLDEVARIHGEIRKVMQQVGFQGTLQDFFRFMREDKRFQYPSEEALLKHYRSLEAKIDARIGEQFSLTPKAGFEIRTVEAYRAKSAAGGSYQSPSEDGTRPGIFYVNTYDLPTRKTWDAEDLYLHEAIPGHHFQIALQQELKDVPAFRRFGRQTAYTEGWGLYAESLGKSLGVYEDPYDYFGYLQNELWRAIRLVTDTGLHSKGWTREQVIRYMMENSAESETQSTAEAERYIAWPSQALAYKIGEMKIQALKRRAQQALGDRFDPREFHAEVLKDGAVPLSVLEAKIDRWIASKKR